MGGNFWIASLRLLSWNIVNFVRVGMVGIAVELLVAVRLWYSPPNRASSVVGKRSVRLLFDPEFGSLALLWDHKYLGHRLLYCNPWFSLSS